MNVLKKLHRNYFWLLGICCGICLGWMIQNWMILLAAVLLLVGVLLYARRWREICCLMLALVLGLGAVCRVETRDSLPACRLDNAVLKINDVNAVGAALRQNETLPVRLTAEFTGQLNNEKIQLYFPYKLRNPGLMNGEKIRVTGNFYPLELPTKFFMAGKNGDWQDISRLIQRNSYADYLRRSNIAGTVVVENIEILPHQKKNFFADWRRNILQRLDADLSSQDGSEVLAAITQGAQSRLNRQLRGKFSAVGAAHLFSVSGLHVGVLAILLLIILQPLPKIFHWLLAIGLVGYVISTGGNAPAWRACGLVLLLELLRRYLLYCSALEILSLICGVMLLINPYYITDAGFQYSFAVTAMLIAAAGPVREMTGTLYSVEYCWGEIPRWKKFLLKCRCRFAAAAAFAIVASAVSWILTLYHQNQIFAGSMLVNLLIIPVLTPLFLLAMLKTALPEWQWLNVPLEIMLDYIQVVVEFFYSLYEVHSLMRPVPLAVISAIVMLLLILLCRRHRAGVICALLLGLLCVGSVLRRSMQSERIAVVCVGGSLEEPVMALLLPWSNSMYLWNAGVDGVWALDDAAIHYGINRVNRVDFAKPVAACSDGLEYLRRRYIIGGCRRGNQPVRSKVFREHTRDLTLRPGAEPDRLSIGSRPQDSIKLQSTPDGGWQLEFDSRTFKLRRSSKVTVYLVPQND